MIELYPLPHQLIEVDPLPHQHLTEFCAHSFIWSPKPFLQPLIFSKLKILLVSPKYNLFLYYRVVGSNALGVNYLQNQYVAKYMKIKGTNIVRIGHTQIYVVRQQHRFPTSQPVNRDPLNFLLSENLTQVEKFLTIFSYKQIIKIITKSNNKQNVTKVLIVSRSP